MRHIIVCCLVSAVLSDYLVGSALAAAEQIGLAVVVRNDVKRVEPTVAKIMQGDDIIRDEVVQTSADSNAKFVLKDSTNLMLGPNARLKLDRAVFSDEKTVGDISIKLAVGAFRFVTGTSAKESYSISTPIATLGVRGTTLDFLVERLKSTVVLREGASSVCAGGRCVELAKAGDTAVITATGARIDIQLQPSSDWNFDSFCNGMCSPMSFAQAQDSLTTGSLGGGGGGDGGPTNQPGPPALGGIGLPPPTQTATTNSPRFFTGSSSAGGALAAQVSPF